MSKRKSSKTSENLQVAILYLKDAFNRIEGEYSNIPNCCVDAYIYGRTYEEYRQCLSVKDQKKLEKWNYVPCDKCFKTDKRNKLKHNGTSDLGKILFTMIDILEEKK